MVNADQQWHIQRHTKQREAWIKLLRLLLDPGKNFFVTINHNLLDWKRLCAQIDHVPAAKVGKACCCWKRSESWGVCRTPPTLPTSLQALLDPPWEPLVFRNQHFCVCFCFWFISSSDLLPIYFWEFCGSGISIHGLVRIWTIGAKTWGNNICLCGLSNFE